MFAEEETALFPPIELDSDGDTEEKAEFCEVIKVALFDVKKVGGDDGRDRVRIGVGAACDDFELRE